MFRIKFIIVGATKTGPIKEHIRELTKRLSLFAKTTETAVQELTSEMIDNQDVAILLAEDGKTMDSMDFAQSLPKWSEQGQRELTFIIAGPFGFDRKLTKHADYILSLSPMTFPHEMAYLILLEQIYRAGTILTNKTYHY